MNAKNRSREFRRARARTIFLANTIARKVAKGQTVPPTEIDDYRRSRDRYLRLMKDFREEV